MRTFLSLVIKIEVTLIYSAVFLLQSAIEKRRL